MADGRAAHDPDRLPWLTETRPPRRSSDSTPLLFWAFAAIVLVAGVSYWLGMRSAREPIQIPDLFGDTAPVPDDSAEVLSDEAVVPLPPPAQRLPPPGLPDASKTEPAPVPIPGVDRAAPPKPETSPEAKPRAVPETRVSEKPAEPSTAAPSAAAPAPPRAAAPRRTRLQAWPADQSANAYGRVIRVGTFYSRRQAKKGWARIVRIHPGMRRLRAVVVGNQSLRNGQTYYRLQFGTTSQAHSTVLCQRMRVIGLSCVIVGLPGRGVAR
jgi:hypothetical protein